MSHPVFVNKFLQQYYDNGFNLVEGWVNLKILSVLDYLDYLNINKHGSVCEIGIHHGRFFIALNQLNKENIISYAIDVFERQDLNIDNSGRGQLEKFTDNLEKYDHRHKGYNVHIIKDDSSNPDSDIKVIKNGSIRFLSIDGGHTVEHVINDLKIAERILSNEGVVILDDINNHWWMSVTEGLCKYLMTYPPLIPFAVGDNKLFLCKMSYHPYYIQKMQESPFHTKTSKFFGHQLVSI